ncbi:hypothetical protein STTU_4536 [Streptomyces sp. Tu6071]|nr:hypothetical protein STTU_4536 [Streptomyces sp. Tu6071]
MDACLRRGLLVTVRENSSKCRNVKNSLILSSERCPRFLN